MLPFESLSRTARGGAYVEPMWTKLLRRSSPGIRRVTGPMARGCDCSRPPAAGDTYVQAESIASITLHARWELDEHAPERRDI
jgi:hypothetical protein